MNKVSKAIGTEYWTKSFKIKASQACKLYLDTDTKFEVAGDNNTMNKTLRLALVVSNNGTYKGTYMYQIDPTTNTTTGTYNTTLESLSADGINNAISGFTTTGDGNSATEGTPTAAELVSKATKAIGGTGDKALATADTNNGLNAAVGTADTLYEFTQNNEVVDITAYIWMEGCDYDCNNSTVNEITGATNTITATLGFCAGGAN